MGETVRGQVNPCTGAAEPARRSSPAGSVRPAPSFAALLAVQQAELTASDGQAYDDFGCSVALCGETALVGADEKTVGTQNGAGAAYVFTCSGTTWTQQAELTASDGQAYDDFGCSVALCGETAIVGADGHTVGTQNGAGAAYVFTCSGTTWTQQAELTASDAQADDQLGCAVALSGETALVGADEKTVGTQNGAGAAYVFTCSGTTWTQQAELTASDAQADDQLGCAVALSGETALVGADEKTVGTQNGAGAAYVFTCSGTTWTQQAELTASDAQADDQLGCAVALSGETALVGADEKTVGTQNGAGAAYVFTCSGTTWTQQAELTASDGQAYDDFGCSVALCGETAIVGADGHTVGTQNGAGAAYVFTCSGTTWTQQAELTASDAQADDQLGCAVALSGETALVGADEKTVAGANEAGAISIDSLDGTAPATVATGLESAPGAWQRTPVQVTLSASEDAEGPGVATTYYTINGTQCVYATPFTLNDGAYTVTYWSVDKAGNVESAKIGYANVDCKAPSASVRAVTIAATQAERGRVIRLRVRIADPEPSCGRATLSLVVTTRRGSTLWRRVVAKLPTNKALVISVRLRSGLERGIYFIVCRATDAAGNVQARVTRARLRVS